MKNKKLVSQAEFARIANLSRSRITQLVKSGQLKKAIVPVEGSKRILLDVKKARKCLSELDPAKKRGKSATGVFARERAKLVSARRKKIEFDQEVKRGKWILKTQVKDEAFTAGRIARDSFLNIPSRISALVAAESDEKRCYQILHKEIKEVLEEFTRQLKKL